MEVKIKRIYEPYSKNDGFRILVDRLWPRGIKKDESHIDVWLKDIAPSTNLRKWFDHDANKWDEFRMKYHHELNNPLVAEELTSYLHKHKIVTLLFAAKEANYNHAIVLQQFIVDNLL